MNEIITSLSQLEFGSGNASFSLDAIGAIAFLKKAIENDFCVYKTYLNYYKSKGKDFDFYLNEIKKLGFKCNLIDHYMSHTKNAFLFNDNSLLSLNYNAHSFSITVYSSDKEIGQKLSKMAKKYSEKAKQEGYIFAIMKNSNGLALSRIGYAGNALEETNYSKKVMEDYKFVIKDLKSEDPSGRIVILDGKPGTGKTYLVRSILNSVEDALFVIVPPTMVSSLGGPDLLPLLVSNRQNYSKNGPTILILEDADQCLAPRAADNIASISSLLNLGDGIFGTLLDIRIVATTNAKADEMDEAIMRPGRLSRRIEVGALSYEEANTIYQRLVGKKKLTLPLVQGRTIGFESKNKPKDYTLADVYRLARENGWEPPAKKDLKEVSIEEEDDDL